MVKFYENYFIIIIIIINVNLYFIMVILNEFIYQINFIYNSKYKLIEQTC